MCNQLERRGFSLGMQQRSSSSVVVVEVEVDVAWCWWKHWRGLTTHKSDSSYIVYLFIWRKEVVGPSCRLICTLNISSSALGCTIFEVHQEGDDKSHRHAPKSMKSWRPNASPKGTRRRVSKSKGGGAFCMGLGGCHSWNYLWGTGQTTRHVCSADVFSPPIEMTIQFNQECVLSEMW